ncbi:hypothetical protein LCGC14_2641050, partial [marine sediment metagenome]
MLFIQVIFQQSRQDVTICVRNARTNWVISHKNRELFFVDFMRKGEYISLKLGG